MHKSVTVNIEQVEVQKREVLQLTHTIEQLRLELIALKEVSSFLSEYSYCKWHSGGRRFKLVGKREELSN